MNNEATQAIFGNPNMLVRLVIACFLSIFCLFCHRSVMASSAFVSSTSCLEWNLHLHHLLTFSCTQPQIQKLVVLSATTSDYEKTGHTSKSARKQGIYARPSGEVKVPTLPTSSLSSRVVRIHLIRSTGRTALCTLYHQGLSHQNVTQFLACEL